MESPDSHFPALLLTPGDVLLRLRFVPATDVHDCHLGATVPPSFIGPECVWSPVAIGVAVAHFPRPILAWPHGLNQLTTGICRPTYLLNPLLNSDFGFFSSCSCSAPADGPFRFTAPLFRCLVKGF